MNNKNNNIERKMYTKKSLVYYFITFVVVHGVFVGLLRNTRITQLANSNSRATATTITKQLAISI